MTRWPRLTVRHWGGQPPVTLIWIGELRTMVYLAAGSTDLAFHHEIEMARLEPAVAAELLDYYGVPTPRDTMSRGAPSDDTIDVAWNLKALLTRAIYDFGLGADGGGWVHYARGRKLKLQHLHDRPQDGIDWLCRRDADCGGSDEDHAWLMVPADQGASAFFVWHINARDGSVVPPAPLLISE